MVQKAFSLIAYLPDKVLRWIGGSPESLGQEAAGWGDELKSGVKAAAQETQGAQAQMGQKLGGKGDEALEKMGAGIKSQSLSGGETTAKGDKDKKSDSGGGSGTGATSGGAKPPPVPE